MEIGTWINSLNITVTQKRILKEITLSGEHHLFDKAEFARLLGVQKDKLLDDLFELKKMKYLQFKKDIILSYDGQEYPLRLIDFDTTPLFDDEKNEIVHKAKEKLKELSQIHFFGIDKVIHDLSVQYDKLAMKYGCVRVRSLPFKPDEAKRHKNWIYFHKLNHLLTMTGYNKEIFLEVQFKRFPYSLKKKLGMMYPPPNMLYGEMAQNLYNEFVADCAEGAANFNMNEEKNLRDVLDSSVSWIHTLMQSNPDTPEHVLAIWEWDRLSPVYLALLPGFLNRAVEGTIKLPDEVRQVLRRFNRDQAFKETAIRVLSEVKTSVRM